MKPVVLCGLILWGLSGCFGSPVFKGPTSDHFDGEVFFNPGGVKINDGIDDLLRWRRNRDQGPWPAWVEAEPGPAPPERVGSGEMKVTFVNHATVLLQMDGLNILTDPIWSDRTSPLSWAGPERVRAPGIRFEDLPPIDAVIISHDHYDHLDTPTLIRLHEAHRPRLFAGLGTGAIFEAVGIEGAEELDWWQEAELGGGVSLTSVPAQHFSGRGALDRNRTLWMGFVISGSSGVAYFAGDTGFGPHFEEIAARFGPVRLAMLPIGAFRPRSFMAPVHIDPEQAVQAHQVLGARTSVGIHFGTFPLADDGMDEPAQELAEALDRAGVDEGSFWVMGFGEGRSVP